MTKSDCKRWTELSEQSESGGTLAPSDERWARRHEDTCPECAAEARFWMALENALEHPEALDVPLRAEQRQKPTRTTSPVFNRLLRSPYSFLCTAAVAAVTFAATQWPPRRPRSAPLASATFEVRLVEVHGRVRIGEGSAVAGARWTSRDRLRTGDDGRACVKLRDSILACFDSRSDATLDDAEPTHFGVRLDSGRVISKLGPQPSSRPYTVRTRALTATALGTEFVVATNSEHEVSVRLYEGRLELRTTRAGTQTIGAPSAAALDTTLSATPLTDEVRKLDETLRRLVQRRRDDSASVLEVSTRPAGAEVHLDDELFGPTPLSVLVGGGHRLTVSKPGYSTIAEWLAPVFEPRRQRTYELAPLDEGAAPMTTAESHSSVPREKSGSDPKTLLARAQDLRAKGKLRESVTVLHQLIQNHPGSPEARVSLVSLGELELTEFGRAAQALQAFDSYLKVGGALTREARFGKIRALLALGQRDEAERARRAFLEAYPNSIQAEQLRKRASAR
ncbi:MAG: PEGA domain-containing protein [Polyangiaceae bacterium]